MGVGGGELRVVILVLYQSEAKSKKKSKQSHKEAL